MSAFKISKIIATIFLVINFSLPVKLYSQININKYNTYLKLNNQVVFVTAAGWNATNGLMQLYERQNRYARWRLVKKFIVTLGRNGLAFDRHSDLPKPAIAVLKREGDGRSPSGIFKLGPVFSYHEMNDLKMLFKKVDKADICVDDTTSAYYSTLVNTDTATHKDWNSFEHMKADDDSYEYGVWVRYNSDKIFSGDGSCIFLHVWAGEKSSTAGCTAMEKQNIISLIHWLDDKQNPVLLQLVSKENNF